jgi:hypothetical protein
MTSYILSNNYKNGLRIILEPEGFPYTIDKNQKVTVTVKGDNPAFECCHSIDSDGVNCVLFWPDRGTIEIDLNGNNILELM